MGKIKDLFFRAVEIILHIQKVNPNKVFFSSFRGQYNDNPKYISQLLHDIHPEIKQYWVISEKSKQNDIPSYINVLKYNTFKYCIYKNQCKVIVENGAGNYVFYATKYRKKLKMLLKNKKQKDLSTWHGNPIKHIGAQIPGNENWTKDTFFTTSDVLMSGCTQIKEVFEQAFLNKMPIVLSGTPRNDILFDESLERKEKIRKKLGLPNDKKIILYAPTYRYSVQDSGVIQMSSIDFEMLFATLKKKFGGEWVFVFRVHNLVVQAIDTAGIVGKIDNQVLDGNKFDDMAEYLYACDALLTDYSGAIYDVALTNKPCFLFAHDRENYVKKERGLYMELEKFPYPFADSFNDLIHCIEEYDCLNQEKKRIAFLHMIGNVENGSASLKAIQMIDRFRKE